MKLYVNEKLFSMHKKFYIKDENNFDVYEISSKFFSFGDKTTIKDMNDEKVVYIEQELFHLTPNYNVYINDEFSFKITKKYQPFKKSVTISFDKPYKITGNIEEENKILENKVINLIRSNQ